MIAALRRGVRLAIALLIAGALAVIAAALFRREGDMPWTPLDLGGPLGAFTMPRLAGLAADPARCRLLIERAGVGLTRISRTASTAECGYRDAVILRPGGARTIAFRPAGVALSCPVAAAELMWEWDVIGPAAVRYLGSPVVAIRHYGSYNCRRIRGREGGAFSEHAHANAIDVAGFVLADGRTIGVARDWAGGGDEARFLHAVRDGACRAFATVLSPDYNAAHADHLHLDQAARGRAGAGACR